MNQLREMLWLFYALRLLDLHGICHSVAEFFKGGMRRVSDLLDHCHVVTFEGLQIKE